LEKKNNKKQLKHIRFSDELI